MKNLLQRPAGNQGHGLDKSEFDKKQISILFDGSTATMKTGDIAIAKESHHVQIHLTLM